MDRKKFLRNSLLIGTGVAGLSKLSAAKKSTYDKLMDNVGFNHLPIKENKTMKSVYHQANTRGHANHGWLDTHHTFSFATYRNPERMNFGVLRVLNDDVVTGGRGFSKHPHDNMEIISIPMSGDLEHVDSMGNEAIIKEGDIQVMSAGTGIYHSEKNKNSQKEVRFLQIWLFPKKRGVEPRYDQISLRDITKKNQLNQVLSPSKEDQGVWINQDAWFHIGEYDKEIENTYCIKKASNGLYTFVLEGSVTIDGQQLSKRDGYGVWDTESVNIKTTPGSKILLMDVPMNL
jgi:redox-sensitive bicupin YhaK (pirin superfamily)